MGIMAELAFLPTGKGRPAHPARDDTPGVVLTELPPFLFRSTHSEGRLTIRQMSGPFEKPTQMYKRMTAINYLR